MVIQAQIRLRHRGCITEHLRGEAFAAQISSDADADLIMMRAPDAASLERYVAKLPHHHEAVEIIARTADSVVYRTRNPKGGAVQAILASRCTILWPSVYRDGLEHYTILAPARANVEAALERLGTMGEYTIVALHDVAAENLDAQVSLAELTTDLTARQLDVLRLALDAGYYDSPRKVGTAELAERSGLAPSTFDEHLRKAEGRIMRRVGSWLDTYRLLGERGLRKRGRPRKL